MAISWIPPPKEHPQLGELYVINDECWHYDRRRGSTLAMARVAHQLTPFERQRALQLGMYTVGQLVYRPVCSGCRRCTPFRVVVEQFEPSRSQRRVQRRCDGRFAVTIGKPQYDEERLVLYRNHRVGQHGDKDLSHVEVELQHCMDMHSGGIELAWRDQRGALVGIGLLDDLPDGLVSEQFFWDPSVSEFRLGTYSALYEIELCRARGKPFYYLGPVVRDARRTRYKVRFAGGEVWDGEKWMALPSRDIEDPRVVAILDHAERRAAELDAQRFRLDLAQPIEMEEPQDEITETVYLDQAQRAPDVSDLDDHSRD